MAVGDGGFKQVAFGFDKNEVNEYISDLRKKMKSMEEDMKSNNKKTDEALKLAEEADERIKAAEKAGEDKLAEVNKQLSIEQERAAKFKTELDTMKKDLEQERKKMSDMLLSGKGVSAEAQKAYTEVIDKAKADSQSIIDEANEKAAEILAQAEEKRAAIEANATSFLDALKEQLDTITAGYNSISSSASELLGAAAVTVAAPVVAAPVHAEAKPVAAPAVEEKPVEKTVDEKTNEKPAVAPVEVKEEPAPVVEEKVEEAPAAESKAEMASVESMPAATANNELASFDDVWGGNELAQTIYNNEKENAVPLVNPEQKNLFGEDLFNGGEDIKVEELTDKFEPAPDEEIVDEIKPLDVSDVAKVSYNDSFDNDLLAQTMPSGSMGSDVNESLLEAVKAAEKAFEVQPSITDLDMDDDESTGSAEDDLMKALREAEEALNNMAAPPSEVSMDDNIETITSNDSADDSSNPWADLQKQLEAMEQSGDTGDIVAPTQTSAAPAEPAAPSADDSAIWNFGSSDSDDDMSGDMSGDMFGGFGGF